LEFRQENEYEILHKRLRPHFIGCQDAEILCRVIDLVHTDSGLS